MFGLGKIGKLGAAGSLTLVQRAINLLKSKGADAHLWDFSTLTGLYQDSAGTTPVTAPDQPIGLCLDSMGVLSDVNLVTNGGFDDASWWSVAAATISGGVLNYVVVVATAGCYRLAALTVGKYYEVTFEIKSISAGGIQAIIGESRGTTRSTVGVFKQIMLCTVSGDLKIYSVGASTTATVDNISVREITGIHAAQSTSAKKPTLRRGVVNRQPYSTNLAQAGAYTPSNISFVGGVALPSAVSGQHFYSFNLAQTGTPNVTLAVVAKASGYDWLGLAVNGAGITTFDLTNGVVGATQTGGSPTITPLGEGKYLCLVSRVYSTQTSYLFVEPSDGQLTWTPNGTSGIVVDAVGLFTGTLTASEILAYGGIPTTTSAPASSSQGHYWAEFDGVDDCMVAANMNLSGTDKITYLAGATKVGSTAWAALLEHTANPATTAGGFGLNAPGGSSDSFYVSSRGATGNATKTVTGYAPPVSVVLSNRADLSAATSTAANSFRVNGVTVASAGGGAAPGGGNFANSSLFIGQRNAASFPFSGAVSSVSVISSLLTDAELLLIEKMAANKAGVSL